MLVGPFRSLMRAVRHPALSRHALSTVSAQKRGAAFAKTWSGERTGDSPLAGASDREPNPLMEFFDHHSTGRGLWKWRHYFDIYHRHLQKFFGKEVHVAEVGIYSGGSLEMWKQYFGPRCHV